MSQTLSPDKFKIRALSPSQVVKKKRIVYPFEGKFRESFGSPECFAKWFVTGPSYSGKSSFLFMLCHYLTTFGKLDYDSFEEGDAQTVADKINSHGLLEREGNWRLLAKVPVHQFHQRLSGKKSAVFGVLDSLQHSQIRTSEYIDLVNTLCNPKKKKSLLFVSHWEKNTFTKFVKHDCDIKIEVIGFVANVQSRYGGNKPFLIWEDGAKKYWGKKYLSVIEGRYWPGQKK